MPTLDQLMKDINKKFKAEIATTGVREFNFDRIPFSSPRLNYMLYGGLPVGRLVEFCGEENGGKTTTALDAVANAQRLFPDRRVVYVDCENTLDLFWAEKLGVDVERLIVISPQHETAEQIFEMVLSVIETDEVILMVLDSIGVMVSAQAYEKTMEDKTYGGISSALTLFSKKAIPLLTKHKCTLIGINQMRDDMNSSYGGTITTGGRAWKHNCSLRLEFRRGDYIDDKGTSLTRGCENPAGNLVKCAILKTKVCRPDRKVGYYTLKYMDGIDYVSDIIDVAIKENIVNQAGAWYTILDPETGEVFLDGDNKPLKFQGRASLREFLLQNEDDLEYIRTALSAKFQ